jgi:HlyD family secretion protein
MHRPPLIVRVVVLAIVIVLVGAGTWYYLNTRQQENGPLTASGTIEADSVSLQPLTPGRVLTVAVDEGDTVVAGAPLVTLDGATLQSQRDQAQAAAAAADANATALEQNGAVLDHNVAAADANVAAAQAKLDQLKAGPTTEQLAVAQSNVDAAQTAVNDLDDAYDKLSNAAEDTPAGRALKLQRDQARAGLVTAQAQQDLLVAGARPEEITAAQAQVTAAQAQADAARAQKDALQGQIDAARAQADASSATIKTLDTQLAQLTISAPISGVVLTRAIDPGEYAAPGATLLVIGALDDLTLTVYVPEDRYGALSLGQQATVHVDSFPDASFGATIAHISDQAEFTPRNVQTAEGRKSTVFAIKLDVPNSDGRLKPGMPADVNF